MKRKGCDERVSGDPVTQRLIDDGVFSVKGQSQGKAVSVEVPSYSILSGIKYTFLLSLFLWWFPLVGNMAAGYVGGRRSGSAWKGVVAAIIPLIVIWCFFFCRDHGLLPTLITTILSIPGMIDAAILNDFPVIAPYYQAGVLYVNAFLVFLQSMLQYQVNMYLVTIVFAYLGGAVSELKQKEMGMYGSSSSAHITLNLFHSEKGDEKEDVHSSVSDLYDDEPRPMAHTGRGYVPRQKKDMIPMGLRSYPNWRRRRVKGEKDEDNRRLVRERRVDPIKKLEQEGISLRSDIDITPRRKRPERLEKSYASSCDDDEEDDEKDTPETKDEEKVKLSAIERAISKYMQGQSGVSSPATPQEKNWDVL